MTENLKKWICRRCTYENWPISVRCTLCDTPQHCTCPKPEIGPPFVETSNSKLLNGGWSCPACTFDNWAASSRCTQCGTSSSLAPVSKHSLTESSPPPSSLTSLGVVKWTCPSCTYENWPKSNCCVMCRVSPPSPSLPSTNPSAISFNIDWLSACKAVIIGDSEVLQKLIISTEYQSFLSRQLTSQECQTLENWCGSKGNVFKPGLSLLDLSRAYNRSEWISSLSALCPKASQARSDTKRSICQTSIFVAKELQHFLDICLCQRKGPFHCYYLTEFGTFYLPAKVRDLPSSVQEVMIRELCDTEAQNELEVRSKAINWWIVYGRQNQPTSRFLALWNRTDGDCLLDSLMQACWGVFDQQGTLRHALSESIKACEMQFYRIWREHEVNQAASQYQPNDEQLLRDWRSALTAAGLKRSPLEQIHIFVLAHVLRRPIIVYSVKYIHNYRNEPIGLANFEGVYLPLLWESSFCSRDPIVLGYTRGHFSALIPTEPSRVTTSAGPVSTPSSPHKPSVPFPFTAVPTTSAAPTSVKSETKASDCASTENCDLSHLNAAASERSVYVPLFDQHGTPLPVPFAPKNVASSDMQLIRDRLETIYTRRGLLLARLRLPARRHYLVESIVGDWFLVYHRMAATKSASSSPTVDDGGGRCLGAFCDRNPFD